MHIKKNCAISKSMKIILTFIDFLAFKEAVNETPNINFKTNPFWLAIFASNSSGDNVTGNWIIPINHGRWNLLQYKLAKLIPTVTNPISITDFISLPYRPVKNKLKNHKMTKECEMRKDKKDKDLREHVRTKKKQCLLQTMALKKASYARKLEKETSRLL